MDLSVIVPCYNEQECLPLLFDRATSVFGGAGLDYELVLVDDGSKDGTWGLSPSSRRPGAPRTFAL